MELRDLRYFLACVDEGSVTKASRRVHVAQPTLSHALRRLEVSAGAALLERRPRHLLRPTPAGALLAARARHALEIVRGFSDDLQSLRGIEGGRVRIATIQSLAATLLPPTLATFARQFPKVEIDVHVATADEVTHAVQSGRADLGLMAADTPPLVRATLGRPAVEVLRLHREPFLLLVPQTHTLAKRSQVAIAELATYPLLLVPATSPTGAIIQRAFAAARVSPHVTLTIDSAEALLTLVRENVGLTILPAHYARLVDPRAGLRAINLVRPTPWRDVFALRPSGTPSPASLRFLDLLPKREVGTGIASSAAKPMAPRSATGAPPRRPRRSR